MDEKKRSWMKSQGMFSQLLKNRGGEELDKLEEMNDKQNHNNYGRLVQLCQNLEHMLYMQSNTLEKEEEDQHMTIDNQIARITEYIQALVAKDQLSVINENEFKLFL